MGSFLKLASAAGVAALLVAGCATAREPEPSDADMAVLFAMLAGQSNPEVDIAEAEARARPLPLGSEENPIRAEMPPGQRAYLSRLRCSDGRAPRFARIGSFGAGPYGNILDGYDVVCEGAEPARTTLYLDMYHPGHVEPMAPPGFTIAP